METMTKRSYVLLQLEDTLEAAKAALPQEMRHLVPGISDIRPAEMDEVEGRISDGSNDWLIGHNQSLLTLQLSRAGLAAMTGACLGSSKDILGAVMDAMRNRTFDPGLGWDLTDSMSLYIMAAFATHIKSVPSRMLNPTSVWFFTRWLAEKNKIGDLRW